MVLLLEFAGFARDEFLRVPSCQPPRIRGIDREQEETEEGRTSRGMDLPAIRWRSPGTFSINAIASFFISLRFASGWDASIESCSRHTAVPYVYVDFDHYKSNPYRESAGAHIRVFKRTHRSLFAKRSPVFQRLLDIPQSEPGDGDLPRADVVQVPVLRLYFGGFGVVVDGLERLRADQRESAGAEQEEYA